MSVRKVHAKTMKVFLWVAFCINIVCLVLSIAYPSPLLTGVSIFIALFILLLLERHLVYSRSVFVDSSNGVISFLRYLKSLVLIHSKRFDENRYKN